jgi:hypothetical protein
MRLNLFVSAFIGAASVLAASGAMAQCTTKSIPLPGAALLTPPPESGCAFQIATPNAAPSQLDYEAQCHRNAGVILRDRLLKLQASVGETVKAANRACPDAVSTARPGSRPSIPLPRSTLLTRPPDLDCTFKDSSDAADSAPRPTPAEAIAAVRMKLDYERQCYRHNEIILRNGLEQLQAAVGETIKAVTGNDRSAASAAKGKPAAMQQPAAKQQSAAATQQPLAMQQPAAATQQPLAMQRPAAMEEQTNDRASRTQAAPCAALSSTGRCVGRDPDPRVRSMMSHDTE